MLRKVLLSTDVALVCCQHAFTTDKEEIMGLLIGEVQNDNSLVSIVSSVILRRLDKKPDRVEISEEQLVQATVRAEELAAELQRPLRVVGWYHSHPHITVWPSHVDLATQSMYQRMDSSFVGLIFAVFLRDQNIKSPQTGRSSQMDEGSQTSQPPEKVQITCFQSITENSIQKRREIELEITYNKDSLMHHNLQIMAKLPEILKEEEYEAFRIDGGQNEILTKQHNFAVRTLAIGHLVDKVSRPLLEGLVARNEINALRLKALKKHHQELMKKLENHCSI